MTPVERDSDHSGPASAEDAGRVYDRWLLGGGGVSAVYARWYLRHRSPREYLQILEALGAPVSRLLDVGCATGVSLEAAAERGWGSELLAGVDVSSVALTEARHRLLPLGSRVALEVAPADALPFAEASFDVVTCNGVVKYLDDDALDRFCREALRVLAPAGRVAVGEFGPRVTEAAGRLWRVAAIEERRLRPATELAAALAAAGFSDVRAVPVRRIRRFPYDYVAVAAAKPA